MFPSPLRGEGRVGVGRVSDMGGVAALTLSPTPPPSRGRGVSAGLPEVVPLLVLLQERAWRVMPWLLRVLIPSSSRGGVWLGLFLILPLSGCSSHVPPLPRLAQGDVVLAFGDSLTHGTGADSGQSYPVQLQALIGHKVVNAGVPGETTLEGLKRLPDVLAEHQPRLLLLCLGGNDMLRHQDLAQAAENLRGMVRLARDQGVAVVLIGVPEPRLLSDPPPFYEEIAREFGLPYEGEVFDEVLKDRTLKADPVHANGQGYRQVAERLAVLLKKAGAL